MNEHDFKVVLQSRKIEGLNSIMNDVRKCRFKIRLYRQVEAILVGIPGKYVRKLEVNDNDEFTSAGKLGNRQKVAFVLKNVPGSLLRTLEEYNYKLREFNDLTKFLGVSTNALR